jgi:hypothetical protein
LNGASPPHAACTGSGSLPVPLSQFVNNIAVTAFVLPALNLVKGNFRIVSNRKLTSISLPLLDSIGGGFEVRSDTLCPTRMAILRIE